MILVTGATGLIGRHLCCVLLAAGYDVRAQVRHDSALQVLPSGIHTVVADVVNAHGLAEACAGVETVIHLVGIIRETRTITFDKVHVAGTTHIVAAAAAAGVRRFIYVSALGAGRGIPTAYFETKLRAEELVQASGLAWTILRPSVVIGCGGGFLQALVDLVQRGPVIPVAGTGKTRMEPIDVDDLCAVIGSLPGGQEHWGGTWELGGPEVLTFDEMVTIVAARMEMRKPMVHIPLSLMFPMARVMWRLMANPPVTVDELRMMQAEALCAPNSVGDFGVAATPFAQAVSKALSEAR